jgi:hypothetical protein
VIITSIDIFTACTRGTCDDVSASEICRKSKRNLTAHSSLPPQEALPEALKKRTFFTRFNHGLEPKSNAITAIPGPKKKEKKRNSNLERQAKLFSAYAMH